MSRFSDRDREAKKAGQSKKEARIETERIF